MESPPDPDLVERLGLEATDPDVTYLDEHDEVWIGDRWDVARRGTRWSVYRKGDYRIDVGAGWLAFAIVADALGLDALAAARAGSPGGPTAAFEAPTDGPGAEEGTP